MNRPRAAFTAIELLASVSIMILLAGITVRGVFDSLRGNAIGRASADLEQVLRAAATRAREADAANLAGIYALDPAKRYGAVLVDDRQVGVCYAAVTYGATATPADILLRADGKPMLRVDLPPTLALYTDPNFQLGVPSTAFARLATPGTVGHIGVAFQYGTGNPVADAAAGRDPTFLGYGTTQSVRDRIRLADAQVIAAGLAVGSVDRTMAAAITMDAVGRFASVPLTLGLVP